MRKVRSSDRRQTPAGTSPGQMRRPLALRKKIAFAALTLALAFVVLEAGLRMLGIGDASSRSDPFVGFSGYYPLFVPSQTATGDREWRTAQNKLTWFNDQSFPEAKSDDAFRIFCLGGSTTYGRPYDDATSFCGWLRALLPSADPTRRWELINAGGISYASYRVARVAEEVAAHRPDLLIIYTGHNEFLERRTYPQLTGSPELLRETTGWMSRLRTFSAIQSLVRSDMPTGGKTGAAFELPTEVEAILDSSVGLEAYHRDHRLQADVLRHFRHNLHRIVDVAESAGAAVVLIVPASQLRDCRPFKSQHRDDLTDDERMHCDSAVAAAADAADREDWEASLDHAEESLELDDAHALGHFLKGTALWALDRQDEAKEAFIRARDEDVCALRATTDMCQIVRDVGRERDVPVIDFVELTDGFSDSGVSGADLFLDHVHPTIEVHRQLALALIRWMTEDGLVTPSSTWGEAAIAHVTADVEGRIDAEDHALALLNLSKVLSWAGKYEEADRVAEQAAQLGNTNAELLYQTGSGQFRDGNLPAALETYQRAVKADAGFAPAQFGVGLILAELGRPQEALPYYRRAAQLQPRQLEIRFNYGNTLSETGDFASAEREYRAAIVIHPGFAPAHNSLGIVLVQQDRIAEALAAFRQAIELDPSNENARSNLERAMRAAGSPGPRDDPPPSR